MPERVRLGRRGLVAALGAAVLVAGCGGMTPDGASEDLAKQAYQHLVRKEDAALEAMLVPSARNPGNTRTYDIMRSLIPAGEPSVARTNWQAYAGTAGRRVTYQHTYTYADRVVMATTVLVAPVGSQPNWQVQTFNVNVGPAPAGASPPAAGAKPS